MDFTFFAPWHQVLPRDAGHVVACSGGCSRAALLAAIAGVYAEAGLPLRHCGPGEADPGDDGLVLADAGGPGAAALPDPAVPAHWPARTSLAVLEVSAAAVGGRADAALAGAGLPTGIEAWTILEWEHLDALVAARTRALPPEVPAVLAVTGLEEQPDSIGLFAFTGRMMADPRLAVVLFCSAGPDGLEVRACCRSGPA